MPEAIASATGFVQAPAAAVSRMITDYCQHHLGRTSEFIHFITEPDPDGGSRWITVVARG